MDIEQALQKLAAEQSAKVKAMWPESVLIAQNKIIDEIVKGLTK